jgi:hypothetical protein
MSVAVQQFKGRGRSMLVLSSRLITAAGAIEHYWGQPLFESLSTDDNPGYLWTSQLVTWLGEIAWDA